MLLAALPAIAAEEPEVQLWLSGPGDPAALLAAAPAVARERVRTLGVGEAGAQGERYGRAWVTCLPSRYDSFGLTLLESLACGTPIVASTHAAPQELVSRRGHRRAVRAGRPGVAGPGVSAGAGAGPAARDRRHVPGSRRAV